MCGGFTKNQAGADFNPAAFAPRTIDRIVQSVEGFSAQFVARKTNGSERGLGELTELDIVKAHDRNIFGHVQAGAADGAECADGREIVGGIMAISPPSIL